MNEIIKREFINHSELVKSYRGGIYKDLGLEYRIKCIHVDDFIEAENDQYILLNTENKKFDLKLITEHDDEVFHKVNITILELHKLEGLEFLKVYDDIKPVVKLVDKENDDIKSGGYKIVILSGLLVESHLQLNQ